MNLWHFALKFVRFPITCKLVWSFWPEFQAFNGTVLPNILLVSLNYHNAPFNFYKRMYTPHQHHHPATHIPIHPYTKFINLCPCIVYPQFSKHTLLCEISVPLEISSAWNVFPLQLICLANPIFFSRFVIFLSLCSLKVF